MVSDDSGHRRVVEQVAQGDLMPAPGPVAMLDPHFPRAVQLRVEVYRGRYLRRLGEVIGMDPVRAGRADVLLGRETEHPFDTRARVLDLAGGVDDGYHVERVLHE